MLARVPTLMKTRSPCSMTRAAGVQCHLHRLRFRESRLTHYQLRPAGPEVREVRLDQLVDHAALAAGHTGHVHAHRPGHHTQTRRRVDERDGLGAVDYVLARQAGDVRAGAADHRPFDDDGLLALFRQGPAEELARDAAADDQIVNVLDGHSPAPEVPGAARDYSGFRQQRTRLSSPRPYCKAWKSATV